MSRKKLTTTRSYSSKSARSTYGPLSRKTYSYPPSVKAYAKSSNSAARNKGKRTVVRGEEKKLVNNSKSEAVSVKSLPVSKVSKIKINQLESTNNSNIDVKSKSKKDTAKRSVSASSKVAKRRKPKTNHEKKQTIASHIEELRMRLIGCIAALVLGGAIGYHFQAEIIDFLVKPLGQQLFYNSPTGGFDFLIKICLFFGFLLAIPVIIYNFIRFLAPTVPERVTYSTYKLLAMSIILALLGVSFAYYISLPAALHFLNNFSNDQIQSLISAQEYFNFVMIYMAGFAALFQMPLVFAFINKVTPLKPKMLMQKQRIVILVSFIVAAILTPTPDPMNQTIMAIPIIGLYQTSIGVVWQDNKRKKRKQKKKVQRASKTASSTA